MNIKILKRSLGSVLSLCIYGFIVYAYAFPNVTIGKYVFYFFIIPIVFAVFAGLMRLIGWLFK